MSYITRFLVAANPKDIFGITELAGVTESLPDDLEGGSLVPLLQRGGEGDVRRAREELHQRLTSYLDAVGATIPDPSTMTPGTAPGAGMGMGAGATGMGGEQ